MARGIDYSGPMGAVHNVNRDPETGIRYGIIPSSCLGEFALDDFESEYDPHCPHCGEELDEDFDAPGKCPECEKEIADGGQFADEPSRTVVHGKVEALIDSTGDVWVFKSPYFTRAAFCSPCAPGACYLTSPCDDGARAYCLGPDWLDGEPPYPIYSVETGELVKG